MKIKEVKISGFGCLKGAFSLEDERPAVILAPNESGKSTFAEVICWLLFGVPPRIADKPKKPVDIYRPWDGSPFKAEALVETNGRRLRIFRDFEEGSVEIWDESVGRKVTEEFRTDRNEYDIGKVLLGITRADFEKIAYVPQKKAEALRDGASIVSYLQRLVSSGGSGATAHEAIEALKNSLKKYELHEMHKLPCTIEREINRLQERQRQLEGRCEELEEKWKGFEREATELNGSVAEEKKLYDLLKRQRALLNCARLRELKEQYASKTKKKEELEACEKDILKLDEMGPPPEDAGRIGELLERMKKAQAVSAEWNKRIEEICARLKGLDDELKGLREYENFTESDLNSLKELFQRRAILEEDVKTFERDLVREEARLAGKDVDIEKAKRWSSAFGTLSEEESKFLLEYAGKKLEEERQKSEVLRKRRPAYPAPISELMMLALFIMCVLSGLILFLSGHNSPAAFSFLSGLVFVFLFIYFNRQRRRAAGGEEVSFLEISSDERERRLEEIGRKAGFASGPEALAAFREKELNEILLSDYNDLARNRAVGQQAILKLKEEFLALWKERGGPALAAEAGLGSIRSHLEAIAGMFETRRKRIEFERQKKDWEESLESSRRTFSEAEAQLSSILAKWGVQAEDLEEGAEDFRKKEEEYRMLLDLREKELPRLRAEVPDAARLGAMKEDIEKLEEKIRNGSNAHLEPEAAYPSRYYHRKIEELEERREELLGRIRDLRESVGRHLEDIQREQSETSAELEKTCRNLKIALSFRYSVHLAIEALEKISAESYRSWAEVLGGAVNEIIGEISPEYGDLSFQNDLNFSIMSRKGGIRLDAAGVKSHLSTGAIDQLYLAARLALCSTIGALRESLPLILDDSFASFDGERFASGMKFLLGLATGSQQIIILSCHEERYLSFLKREGLEEKVNLIRL